MTKRLYAATLVAVVLTAVALMGWLATERHYYTKFQVIERVVVDAAPADPIMATLYDEGEVRHETVTRDEFHLGLLPTPQGLFDRHILSVLTLTVPPWLIVFGYWWHTRRRRSLRGRLRALAL